MKDMDFEKIFDSMKKNEISEFVITEGKTKYEVRRGGFANQAPQATVVASAPAAAATHTVAPTHAAVSSPVQSAPAVNDTKNTSDNYYEVEAPLVGTFYASPKPEAPAFVEVGDRVKKGQLLCIVEAMKNFNEIESDVDGTIKEICVKTGDLVEFGQVLFRVEQ